MTVSKFPTWWDYLQVVPQPLWWWKFELNNPGWKLSICATLITISHYLETKFDYSYIIFFLRYGFKILHKISQVISSKNEGVTLIFPIQNETKFGKIAVMPLFLFKITWNFCVESKNNNTKRIYKIAIVKFCL